MTEDGFLGLVGPVLIHATPARNLPSILAAGLLRPVTLMRLAGVDPASQALRRNPLELTLPSGLAVLNHQRPLRAGLGADFLDGLSPQDWAQGLDERVFLWPGKAPAPFEGSLDAREPACLLRLDAARTFRALRDRLDLAPINTGSATRRPAQRGSWIFTPATAEVETFREARRRRGLVKGRDSVGEVSLRADIPPDLLASLLAGSPAGLPRRGVLPRT